MGFFRRLFGRGPTKDTDTTWNEDNQRLIALIRERRIEDAAELGGDLVAFAEKYYPRESKERATSYNNMGLALMMAGDYALAEECFRDALGIRLALFGPEHNQVAVVFLNLAQLYKVQAQGILRKNPLKA